MAEAAQAYHHDTTTLKTFIQQQGITMSADWLRPIPTWQGMKLGCERHHIGAAPCAVVVAR
jgi:hypothetical protein